jgi:two-component system sensor histidine kinase PilS (NtrC family)
MAARVLLVTLTLGATVAIHTFTQRVDDLSQPFGWFISGISVFVYLASIGYAILLPRVRDPKRFGALQLVGDIAVVTVLVHVTGGAESGFASIYLLVAVGAHAIGLPSRAALALTAASATAYVVVSTAGYFGLLPAVIGQPFLPWETTPQSAMRAGLINIIAIGATAFLSGNLADQARRAGERAEADRATALDIAALAEDIVRSLSSGLVTLDESGVIVSVNAAAATILGATADTLVGGMLVDRIPAIAPLIARAAHVPVRRSEITLPRDGALLYLGVSVSPLSDGRGRVRGRVINFSDLTELRRKDLELKQKERLAAIGRLAAGVAHEIRNPLAAISGSVELLSANPQVGEDSAQLMQIVLREVDRLNGMIGDLLTYARPRPPVLIESDLPELLAETVRVFAQDRGHASISVKTLPPLDRLASSRPGTQPPRSHAAADANRPAGRVMMDAGQMRQVVWNLLRNAADATPAGGEIAVALAEVDGSLGFEVVDSGAGIAPEDLDRVFDPFFTTKDTGTGLGLATVHRIIEDHHARIDITSEVGRGTRVRVLIPAAPRAKDTPAPSAVTES